MSAKHFPSNLNADNELAFLLTCSRVQQRPEDVAQQQALAQGLDNQRFLAQVDRHRVASMVWHNLKQHPEGTFAPILMQTLAKQHQRNTLDSLTMDREMVHLHRLLARAQIPYCTLKGLPVARKYYGNASLRHSKDIDVLIPESELEKVNQLFAESGYTTTDSLAGLNQRQLAYYLRTNIHQEFTCPTSPVVIELHWRAGVDPLALSSLNLHVANSQVIHQPLAGCDLPLLADDEMLFYLCAHGAEHGWFRLKWVFDLPQVLESRTWDWALLLEKARSYRCEKQLALGLLLAQRLLAWEVPPSVETWLRGQQGVARNYEFALRAIQGPEAWWHGNMPIFFWLRWQCYRARFIDGTARLQSELARLATGRKDWALIPLPNALFFLYFPLRPLLLGWRFVKRRLKNLVESAATAD